MTEADEAVLAAPLSVLELNIRATNALLNNGFSTVGDLLAKTERELARLPLIGPSNMREIKAKLSARGLALHPGGSAGDHFWHPG